VPARRGIWTQIAFAAISVAVIAVAILALGVVVVGGRSFTELMVQHGESVAESQQMFADSVVWAVVLAAVTASLVAVAVAVAVARHLAAPLHEIGEAARSFARGDRDTLIPRRGPEEIESLADSFNQMAVALNEQERMRNEFIANAAHELRTPLTNLRGYLEAMRDGVTRPDTATFDSLLEETERLVRLSRSLDLLAEGDAAGAPPLVELDLAAAVRRAVDLARPALASAGLPVRVEAPASLSARGDPDGLAQVLGNLLQNAARYAGAGGEVVVRAERRSSSALVTVTNAGSEIPSRDLAHVFERFYRVEKSRDAAAGGAGIGLAIVQQIVEATGGSVGVESRDGVTRFWFSLPT
jgi:signal transduction histidine kinase